MVAYNNLRYSTMQIQVTGVNFNIGDSLRHYIEEGLESKVKKYFEKSIEAKVRIAKDAYLYKTNITVNEGVKCGIIIRGNASDNEVYSSFDQALSKIGRQLQKYNDKLIDYRRRRGAQDKYRETTAFEVLPQVAVQAENRSVVPDKAQILSEKLINIETLTVDEALMKMELSDNTAIVFINKDNDKLNFMYQKKNGKIALIEA